MNELKEAIKEAFEIVYFKAIIKEELLKAINEDKKEPKRWIKINNNPVPIFDDAEEEIQEWIDDKNEKNNNNKNFGNKTISENALKESRKQAEELSEAEKSGIKRYTNDMSFKPINDFLRGKISKNQISAKNKEAIKQISKALEKSSLPEDSILYRGVRGDLISQQFKNQEIADLIDNVFDEEPTEKDIEKVQDFLLGKRFIDEGFTSSSYDRNKAFDNSPLMFEINTPKGTKALAVDKLSNKDEGEILINKGYEYKITKIELKKNKENRTQWNFSIDLI